MTVKEFFSSYVMGEGEKRSLSPGIKKVVKWVAIVTTLYNMWCVFGYPEVLLDRALSVGIFFSLTFIRYTMPGTKTKNKVPWYDWVFVALSIGTALYVGANLTRFVTRYPFVSTVSAMDMFFGIVLIVLMLEGSRRIIGPWLDTLHRLCLVGKLYTGNVWASGLFDEIYYR